jgi:hypothetical protein
MKIYYVGSIHRHRIDTDKVYCRISIMTITTIAIITYNNKANTIFDKETAVMN